MGVSGTGHEPIIDSAVSKGASVSDSSEDAGESGHTDNSDPYYVPDHNPEMSVKQKPSEFFTSFLKSLKL